VTSARGTRGASTGAAGSPGTAFVTRDGVVFSATRISTTAPITGLAATVALASTRDRAPTPAHVLLDIPERTVKSRSTAAPTILVAMEALAL
jgi:hypothetical protein